MEKNVDTTEIDTPPKAGANIAIKGSANNTKHGSSDLTEDGVTKSWTSNGEANESPKGNTETTKNDGNGAIAIPMTARTRCNVKCIQLE